MIQAHVEEGGDPMGEGDTLPLNEPQDRLWIETSRIDLFGPQEGGHVRETPGMDMEHGRYGHIDVGRLKATLGRETPHGHCRGQGVEDQLTVTVIDPFGTPSGPGGIEDCGLNIIFKIRERI
jgi:hypothetical protein